MKTRNLALVGGALLMVAVVLGVFSVAQAQSLQMNTPYAPNGMMNGSAMGGMMGNGMMGGMMGRGMGPGYPSNPNQPFDVRFLNEMITHHQMGVMMTQHMVVNSTRSELRDLAQRIITAQQGEITQMQQWQGQWYQSATGGMMGRGMMGGSMMGGMGMMEGMMNGDHMRQMHPTSDFDLMFLQMMIPHHEDAIVMAEQALTQAEHADIKTLAQSIITTQQAEIEEMRGYLRDWYGIR